MVNEVQEALASSSESQSVQEELIALLQAKGALQFGEFTLKSGRQSPYFFNLGAVNDGCVLQALAQCYRRALGRLQWQYDVIFGPAYKGIPLACATACSLAMAENRIVGFGYNRKEAKKHGEGGQLVGDLSGRRVVILDDILTAGTAAREAAAQLKAAGAQVVGLLVALDRQEKGGDGRSAVEAVAQDCGFPVAGIATFEDVISHIKKTGSSDQVSALLSYRERYGTNE